MLDIYFFRMNAQEEHVNAELRSLHGLIGNIVNVLAENEGVDENLIDEGNSLLATVTEAIANYAAGRSINQSKSDPYGCMWTEHRLITWGWSILRLGWEDEGWHDTIREVLSSNDLDIFDRIKTIGRSDQMMRREPGPSKLMNLPFIPGEKEIIPEEQKLSCPVEGCRTKLGSVKAFNLHLTKKHSKEEALR